MKNWRNYMSSSLLALLLMLGGDWSQLSQRQAQLVAIIQSETLATSLFSGIGKISSPTIRAMLRVDRANFVPQHLLAEAYSNQRLGVGHGVEIAPPQVTALMLELAAIRATDQVLEVGTRTGYQTSILAHMAKQVASLEIYRPSQQVAARIIAHMGLDNVHIRQSDDLQAMADFGQFDVILVNEPQQEINFKLFSQLRRGGRMVVPVAQSGTVFTLTLIQRDLSGNFSRKTIMPLRFSEAIRRTPI